MTRGVEALDARPDAAIKDDDMKYLQQHGIKEMLSSTLQELLRCRAADPMQFIIDCIKMGADKAGQDPVLHIAVWRKDRLVDVFAFMDPVRFLLRITGLACSALVDSDRHASRPSMLSTKAARSRSVRHRSRQQQQAHADALLLGTCIQGIRCIGNSATLYACQNARPAKRRCRRPPPHWRHLQRLGRLHA